MTLYIVFMTFLINKRHPGNYIVESNSVRKYFHPYMQYINMYTIN